MKQIIIPCIAAVILICCGCGEDTTGEDITPPSPPILVEKGDESSILESGIDAVPEGDWIRIEWYLNIEDDLAGYEIWRVAEDDTGETGEINDFLQIIVLSMEELTSTELLYHIDRDPQIEPDPDTGFGRGVYYYICAFDQSGNVSSPSDTTYYKLLPKPINVHFDTTEVYTISCSYPFITAGPIYFTIRVIDLSGNSYKWLNISTFYNDPFSIVYNDEPLETGDYSLRIDVTPYSLDGPGLYSGAESNWHYFSIL